MKLLKALALVTYLRRRWLRRRRVSRVWSFNFIPAGARVDTKVSCPVGD